MTSINVITREMNILCDHTFINDSLGALCTTRDPCNVNDTEWHQMQQSLSRMIELPIQTREH